MGEGSLDISGPPCPYSCVLIAKKPVLGLLFISLFTDFIIEAEVSTIYSLTTEANIGVWLSEETPLVSINPKTMTSIKLAWSLLPDSKLYVKNIRFSLNIEEKEFDNFVTSVLIALYVIFKAEITDILA